MLPVSGNKRFRSRAARTMGAMLATVEVRECDITTLDVDAIANAANTHLLHGGGVAGAIARAAGPDLERESRERAPIPLGEAVATTGGALPARWVIHAATMEPGGPTSEDAIAGATAATLRVAEELGCRSVALPAFGTGVGGFPIDRAAATMMREIRAHLAAGSSLGHVVVAVRGQHARLAFELVEDD